jgi:hypothetical protein
MCPGNLSGDLGQRRIILRRILEPMFGDRNGMRAPAPFPDKTRAGLEAESWRGGNPACRLQGLGDGLELPPGRLAEPAMRDFLKRL